MTKKDITIKPTGSIKMVSILKDYFEKRDDILMAFLFGSYAKDITHRESDIDIAIYFRPKSGRLEWEEFDIKYEGEDETWLDLEILLSQNIDLVVLNRARSSIATSAINGIPIIIRDWGLYLDFMLRVTLVEDSLSGHLSEILSSMNISISGGRPLKNL